MESQFRRVNVLEDSNAEEDTVEEDLFKRTLAIMSKISSPAIRSAGTQRTPLKFTHSELIKLHWIVGYKQAAKLTWEKVFTKASLGMLFTREYRNVLWKLNDHKNRGESEEKILELIDLASKYDPREIFIVEKLDEIHRFHQNIYSNGSFASAYQNLHYNQMNSFVQVHPEIIKRNLCIHFGLPYTGGYREEKSEDSTDSIPYDSEGECDKRFKSIKMPEGGNGRSTNFLEETITGSGLIPNEMVADNTEKTHAENTVLKLQDNITQEIQPEIIVSADKLKEIDTEYTVQEHKDNIIKKIQTSHDISPKENLTFERVEITDASKENLDVNQALSSVVLNTESISTGELSTVGKKERRKSSLKSVVEVPKSKFTSGLITIEEFPHFITKKRLNERLLKIEQVLIRLGKVGRSQMFSKIGSNYFNFSEELYSRFLDKLAELKLINLVKRSKGVSLTLYKEE